MGALAASHPKCGNRAGSPLPRTGPLRFGSARCALGEARIGDGRALQVLTLAPEVAPLQLAYKRVRRSEDTESQQCKSNTVIPVLLAWRGGFRQSSSLPGHES